jgi:hypothetical protein
MACVRRAVDDCAKAGAEILEVSLPHTELCDRGLLYHRHR